MSDFEMVFNSLAENAHAAVGRDLGEGVQIVDAHRLSTDYYPRIEVGLPLLCADLNSRELAASVKRTLLNAYPNEHGVTLIRMADRQPEMHQLQLQAADRFVVYDRFTYLYLPPLAPGGSVSDLQDLVAHLRAPEGCPWDREQTMSSLRQDLLSECVEVLEAIDLEDGGLENGAHIAEELGDLLMLVLMLVQIAVEAGRFQMSDVVRGIVTKLVRRHPHVFDEVNVDGVEQVFANWDEIKAMEKAEKGISHGPLDGLPSELPALEKARRLQSKANKAGLLDRAQVVEDRPRLRELVEEAPNDEALGKLLWDLVAVAHQYGLNPENALRSYAVRYRERGGSP